MKKNKALTAAMSVLSLTMISMCAIGGTFAKYTSQDSANDTAKVAKWGVTVEVTGEDAFGTKYEDAIDASGTKVVSADTDNVLAPGTNGTLGSVTIKGTPEVMVDVSVSLDLELEGWAVDSTYYCPLVIGGLKGNDYASADLFEAAVEALVNKTANDVAPGTTLDSTYDAELTWSWAFTGNDDKKDSKLGDAASATIKATWSATVEQVD